jgi:2-polyprenyl-3-methyl-5-hydroxy-6-metoxy-1,4-benzoquinol methylase
MSYWNGIWKGMEGFEVKGSTYMFDYYRDLLGGCDFKGKRVLEIGCGTGVNTILMGMQGAKITLMDYERSALDVAKGLVDNLSLDAEFVCGDVFDYNVQREFDIVHSEGVVEHFLGEKRQRIIDIHAGALVSGGRCVIIVPNSSSLPYRIGKYLAEASGTWIHGKEYPYTRGELVHRMLKSGLRIENSAGGEFLLSFAWLFAPLWLSGFNEFLRRGLTTRTRGAVYKINYNNPLADRWGRVIGAVGIRG